MTSDRDRAIREELVNEIQRQIDGLTVFFDEEGPIYRHSVIMRNIEFVRDKLNGDTEKPPSSL